MQPYNRQHFELTLTNLRNTIAAAQGSPMQSVDLTSMESTLLNMTEQIQSFATRIQKGFEELDNGKTEPSEFQLCSKGKLKIEKITLYYWQIVNFLCINEGEFAPEHEKSILTMLEVQNKCESCLSVNSGKNAHIFIHNFIVKSIKNMALYLERQSLIHKCTALLLVYHFQRTSNSFYAFKNSFQVTKGEDAILQEVEWLGYIFGQLFSTDIYEQRGLSFIRSIIETSQAQIKFYLLHTVGNYLQDMIDKRTTTELVKGFQCAIADIRSMYEAKGKCLIQIKLSKQDLSYICEEFNKQIIAYLSITKQYITAKFNKQYTSEFQAHYKCTWTQNSQLLTQICHILNCVLFIGGYNSPLQDYVVFRLLQEGHLLIFLEISYLLYRNIDSTKFQTKMELVVEMERECTRKLFFLCGLEPADPASMNVKALDLQKVLTDGQLVSILRLLTNLVHINHRAQIPFQKKPQYLHIILSLTRDSVSQMTMKEWAIMFIRNVSESSEILRDEIGKIKVDMKVV